MWLSQQMDSLTAWEAEVPGPRCWQGQFPPRAVREHPSIPALPLCQVWAASSILSTQMHHSDPSTSHGLLCHHICPLCASVSEHQSSDGGHPNDLILATPAKTLFPNKATTTGARVRISVSFGGYMLQPLMLSISCQHTLSSKELRVSSSLVQPGKADSLTTRDSYW